LFGHLEEQGIMRWNRLSWLAVALCAATGCNSGYYPVSGRVAYPDGSPVVAGTVVAESTGEGKPVMAQGEIHPNGTFAMGTTKPNNGAPPGKYRVIVIVPALGDAEAAEGKQLAVDPKFSNYDASKLEFEVTAGSNEWQIPVTRPKKK
jgi:hypothetical protein